MLESAYRAQKASILDVLRNVLHNQTFVLQNEHISHQSLVVYRANNVDFAGHLICAECDNANRRLLTFDQRLATVARATVIRPEHSTSILLPAILH